ncbi:nucleotidyltransferase family protein [Neptunicella sp.]|uniref:nucleotidyltransferase family protein n=1 Tax=Neptunicella sp. TaxID=2125986 RepID=UPI003F68BE5E
MKLAAVILAAGQSRRFDGIKQLAVINRQPMIVHAIEQYRRAGVTDLFVVLGANAAVISAVIPGHVRVIHSSQWQQGMGHSIANAIQQLNSGYSHILIGLADQVGVTEQHIRQIIDAAQASKNNIIATNYGQHIGVPAMFAKADFTDLQNLRGDNGAKHIIQQNQHRLTSVHLTQAAFDIDTRADLQQWQRMQEEEL